MGFWGEVHESAETPMGVKPLEVPHLHGSPSHLASRRSLKLQFSRSYRLMALAVLASGKQILAVTLYFPVSLDFKMVI